MSADNVMTIHGREECTDCRRVVNFDNGKVDPEHTCLRADLHATAAIRNANADGWTSAAEWLYYSEDAVTAGLDAWHTACHAGDSNIDGMRRVVQAIAATLDPRLAPR